MVVHQIRYLGQIDHLRVLRVLEQLEWQDVFHPVEIQNWECWLLEHDVPSVVEETIDMTLVFLALPEMIPRPKTLSELKRNNRY